MQLTVQKEVTHLWVRQTATAWSSGYPGLAGDNRLAAQSITQLAVVHAKSSRSVASSQHDCAPEQDVLAEHAAISVLHWSWHVGAPRSTSVQLSACAPHGGGKSAHVSPMSTVGDALGALLWGEEKCMCMTSA